MQRVSMMVLVIGGWAAVASAQAEPLRPNILFLFADDWGRHASAYVAAGERGGVNEVLQTPNIDRLAARGVLFRNAHVNAPSCTPCRSAVLSGQYFWRTGRGAILLGAIWDDAIPAYPLLLRDAGYHIGKTYKVWGPGTPADAPYGGQQHAYQRAGGRFNQFSQNVTRLVGQGRALEASKQELYAEVRANFEACLAARQPGQPFCYWFGPTNTHRKWTRGSGQALWGIDPDALKGRMPPYLPDVPEVREDLADYLGEAMAFDAAAGVLLEALERSGEAERTLVVVSGDHGAPGFPHGKCNLYRFGTGVALVVAGPGVTGGRVVDDFVNLTDLAPTFLEAAGVAVPEVMTGRSLWPVLRSGKSGLTDPSRTWVVTGRERHVDNAREGCLPYPQRCLRSDRYAYIVNFRPERWPMGEPYRLDGPNPPSATELTEETRATLPDEDSGPTKAWLVMHRNDPAWQAHFAWVYGKRPREELYDLKSDPHETKNLAADPAYAEVRRGLEERLLAELRRTGDPRLIDDGAYYENPPLAGPSSAVEKNAGRTPEQLRR